MGNRLIVLMATVALLLVGAVPVSAAPGGVPGPPPGHGKSGDDVASGDVETPDSGDTQNGPPEWAKAYGKRIKDEYGIPYGHLQQCIRDAAGVETVDGDEAVADEVMGADGEDAVKKALEACSELELGLELSEFPEDVLGAKAFWIFVNPEEGLPVLGM